MKLHTALLVLAVLLVIAPSFASAVTTVTLNAHCSISQTPSGTQAVFHIANTGNGTAANVTITPQPHSVGLSLNPQSTQIGSLHPGTNATASFNVSSYTYPGSYVVGFAAQYTQGPAEITTLYPCTITIGQQQQNYVDISYLNYSRGRIKASFINFASMALPVSIYVMAPYGVFVRGSSFNATLEPGVPLNSTFNVTLYPPSGVTNATYAVAVSTSYVTNNTSVSGYSTVLVEQGASKGLSSQWFEYTVIAVIAALVALILFSATFGRRRRRTHAEARFAKQRSRTR